MRSILYFLLTLVANVNAYTQTLVRGTVLDQLNRHPVPGVTIIAEQQKSSTISAEDGSFTITTKAGKDELLFTHVNYSPLSVAVDRQTTTPLLIELKSTIGEIDEVVVNTGYQRLPKERATGSFNSISAKLFNEQVGTNVLTRLEGIANGLIFDRKAGNNNATNIVIRGLSTIQGPKAPLVIVDNFPYDGDINNLNPNDVENISILKDAAAASIWGTRAGNGVIVITTKKGKWNQATRLQLNASTTIAEKPDLFYVEEMAPADFAEVEQFLFDKGFYNNAINSFVRPPLSPVVELLAQQANGTITPAEAAQQINALKTHDLRSDFDRYVYAPAVNQQYNLNMQGGGNAIAWSLSAGVDQNKSQLDDKYTRVNLRSNNVFKISNKLQATVAMFYTQSIAAVGKPAYGQLNTNNGALPRYTRFADATGKALPVIKDFRQAHLDTLGGGKLLDWSFYPLQDYQHVDNNSTIQDLTGNLGLDYTILPGLLAAVQYQYERQASNGRILYGEQSYFSRNLVNSFTQLVNGKPVYMLPPGGIIDNDLSILEAHNLRGQLSYTRAGKQGSFSGIAGAELRNNHTTGNSSRTYGYNNQVLTYGNVDYVNYYPHFLTQYDEYIPNGTDFTDRLYRYVSYFANGAYTYKQKYTVSLSGRKDGSNLFGVDYNQKTVPLWSIGASWDLSRETFYRFPLFPYIRLRTTYGVSGNADPNRAAVTTIVYGLNSSFTQSPVARIDQYANPSLRWEKVKMFNLGLDFKSRNNRFSGFIEYFRKKGIDLFGTAPIDYTGAGIPALLKNTATIKGQGLDVALNTINLQAALVWTTQLNLSFNKETVAAYYLPAPELVNFTNGGANISAIAGRPVYAVYGYRWAGLDPTNGNPQGIVDGKPSTDYDAIMAGTNLDELVFKGSALPVVSGNLGNTVSWKNWSLNLRLLYKFGYWFQRPTISYSNLFGSRQGHSDYALRWQQPGDENKTTVPSMVYPRNSSRDNFYRGSEVLIEKGDHVRLQYITLAYDFQRVAAFSSLQVYVNVNNLGILWRANDKNIDPDYYNGLPVTRNIALGLRAGF